jgi:hypothetical protein
VEKMISNTISFEKGIYNNYINREPNETLNAFNDLFNSDEWAPPDLFGSWSTEPEILFEYGNAANLGALGALKELSLKDALGRVFAGFGGVVSVVLDAKEYIAEYRNGWRSVAVKVTGTAGSIVLGT